VTFAFRPDIQILRGWAILSVFVYHLLPAWMPGGFLGVDLFFVLSGFLMAAIYDPTAPHGARSFFFSRIRRILPAYYAVLLLIVVVAALRVLPHEFAEVRGHAIYSAFLIPNIGYWLDGSYFANAAFRPGLHLWSLGVEFQFYVLVPLIVWLHNRYPRLLMAIALASFVACLAIVATRPRYAFYLLPFRLWEFFLGFYAFRLTQVWRDGKLPAWLARLSLPLGIGVIAVMFVAIAEGDHPKYGAAFVTAATAVMLVVGMPQRIVSSLAGRAMVVVGQYSYSVYLVHYPVIAYWFYRPFKPVGGFTASALDVAIVTALTALLSVALYHLIENPLRKTQSAPRLFGFQGGLIAALIAMFVLAKPLQQMMLPLPVLQISAAWQDRGPERCGKFAMLVNVYSKACILAEAPRPDAPKFLLVGNSHADAIKTAMAEIARQKGVGLQLFRENCVLGAPGCAITDIADFAKANGISGIVLHSSPNLTDLNAVKKLIDLTAPNGIRVALIDPIPVYGDDVLQGLYDAQRSSKMPDWLKQSLDQYRAANAAYFRDADRIKGASFSRFNPAEFLCKSECRVVSPKGEPFYFDSGHLTHTGARELTPIYQAIFGNR
jgi:peptidoglycan/LPS O-acetylase OafA/YrhL